MFFLFYPIGLKSLQITISSCRPTFCLNCVVYKKNQRERERFAILFANIQADKNSTYCISQNIPVKKIKTVEIAPTQLSMGTFYSQVLHANTISFFFFFLFFLSLLLHANTIQFMSVKNQINTIAILLQVDTSLNSITLTCIGRQLSYWGPF